MSREAFIEAAKFGLELRGAVVEGVSLQPKAVCVCARRGDWGLFVSATDREIQINYDLGKEAFLDLVQERLSAADSMPSPAQ